jgi:protein-tyrosine phosphatase
MRDWLRGGVLIQVTADSLTGHKGRHAERMAHELLERRWVHFLATDAHNTTSRPPRMREAHDLVAAKYGASYAHACASPIRWPSFWASSLRWKRSRRD